MKTMLSLFLIMLSSANMVLSKPLNLYNQIINHSVQSNIALELLHITNDWISGSNTYTNSKTATGMWHLLERPVNQDSLIIDNMDMGDAQSAWGICRWKGSNAPCQKVVRITRNGLDIEYIDINGYPGYMPGMITAVTADIAWATYYNNTVGVSKVLKTMDGGQSWVEQNTAVFDMNLGGFPNVIYFWDENNGVVLGDPSSGYWEIYTTTNGGTNWNRVNASNIPAPIASEYGIIDLYCVVGSTLYFSTVKSRLLKSTDYGYTWSVVNTPVPSGAPIDVVFMSQTHGIVRQRTSANAVWETTDGGINWQTVAYSGLLGRNKIKHMPGTTSSLISTNGGYGEGISYSLDGGYSWTSYQTAPYEPFFGLACFNADIAWVGGITQQGYHRVYRHFNANTSVDIDLHLSAPHICVRDFLTLTPAINAPVTQMQISVSYGVPNLVNGSSATMQFLDPGTYMAWIGGTTPYGTYYKEFPGIVKVMSGRAFSLGEDVTLCAGQCIDLGFSPSQELMFSEFIEGSNYNRAFEIFNASSQTVDLHEYGMTGNMNGGPWSLFFRFPQGYMLPPGEVVVISHSWADTAILNKADLIYAWNEAGFIMNQNGDDVRALVKITDTDTTIIDYIGDNNLADPGNGWEVAGVPEATFNHTLVRKPHVSGPNNIWSAAAGTDSANSEWLVFPMDDFSHLGSHQSNPNLAFQWNTSQQTEAITVCPSILTEYQLAVTDERGCSANNGIYVDIKHGPAISLGEDTAIASGECIELSFSTGDVFFSEYIEGSANNKALELYNPSAAAIDLSTYRIIGTNFGTGWDPNRVYYFPNGSVIQPHSTYTLINSLFDPLLFHPDSADVVFYVNPLHPIDFNGNDVRGLEKQVNGQWILLDVIGDPFSNIYFSVAGVASGLAEHTIIRKPHITSGNADWYAAAGTNTENSEWIIFPQDYASDFGKHSTVASDYQFLWSTGDTTSSIIVCPTESTTYSLTLTDAYGCQSTDSILIETLCMPVEVWGDTVVCEDGFAEVHATPGMTSYIWSTGDTTSSILFPYSGIVSSTLYVTVTDTLGCIVVKASQPIVGYHNPWPYSVQPSHYVIYEGDSLTFNPDFLYADSYLWSTGDASQAITVHPFTDTSYTITASNIAGCSRSLTFTISLKPLVLLNQDTVICPGECIQLSTMGEGTFVWSTGDTGTSIQVCPVNHSNTYCVTVTRPYGNVLSACVDVLVDMTQFLLSNIGDDTLCKGDCTTLWIQKIGHFSQGSYLWEDGSDSTHLLICPTISDYHYITTTTTYGCIDIDSIYVEVASVSPTTLYTPGPFCEHDDPIKLSADWSGTFSGAGISLDTLFPAQAGAGTWPILYTYADMFCSGDTTFYITLNEMPGVSIQAVGEQCDNSGLVELIGGPMGGSFSGTGVASNFFDPVVAGMGAWQVTYTYTTPEGCTDSLSMQINVHPTPEISINPIPIFCEGDAPFLLTGDPPGLVFSGPGIAANLFDPALAGVGSHNIGFFVADTNGCSSAGGMNISVYPRPQAEAGPNDTLFGGGCVTLTATGGEAYLWSTGESTQSILACNTSTLVYHVTVTSSEGCSDVDSVTVFYFDTSTLIVSPDTAICEGDCAVLRAYGNGNLSWSHGASGSPVSVCPSGTTTYFVSLTDAYGQVITDSIEVTVWPSPQASTCPDTAVCQGECISLEAFGGSSYFWSTGETGNSIITCPASPASYTVTVVSAEGCTDTASLSVDLYPIPQLAVTPDTSIIQGSCISLNATGGITYAWSTGDIGQSILVCPISTETYTVTVTDVNACSSTAAIVVTVDQPMTGFRAKVLLQGPYQQNGRMNTSRATNGYIPLYQPYNRSPWHYDGTENLDTIPSDMVDWLLIELRSASDSTQIFVRKAVVLLSDGTIVDEHLDSNLTFLYGAKTPMYVVIDHLSHLPVMTAQAVDLANTFYDFSDPSHYPLFDKTNVAAIEVAQGVFAMIAGDLNNDYRLKYSGANNDRSLVLTKLLSIVGGTSITSTSQGYYAEDISMDGLLKYSGSNNDPSRIIQNLVLLTGSASITSTFLCPVPPGVLHISPAYCGLDLIDFRDGQQYPTVQIGTQCWMTNNLNIGEMVNSIYTGANHSEVSHNGIIEKYCYDNDSSNCLTYGGLYDWNEMMHYTTVEGARGICPIGWHIPTDAEWCTLLTYLEPMLDCNSWGGSGTDVGGKMKQIGLDHWITPNHGANNSSGFTALGAGIRHQEGNPAGFAAVAYFWSSTTYANGNGISRDMHYSHADVNRHAYNKTSGFSLRCIGDNIPPCTPAPDQAYAGSDSLNIPGTSFNLQANTPVHGSSQWTILSGQGGSFMDDTVATTPFTGQAGESYILTWTISNHCGSTSDTVMISFAPATSFSCGDTLLDTRDGQEYPTVQIGTQCWMAKNLNIGQWVNSYSTGTTHSDQSNNGIIEKYCFSNDTSNCLIYGGLYDWNEMMNYDTTPGNQGICAPGWHIPTSADWTALTDFLGANAGGHLKEIGLEHWNSPNTDATNTSGFTAYGGGYRYLNGIFNLLKYNAYFWSSTKYSEANANFLGLYKDNASVNHGNLNVYYGFSARCIMDSVLLCTPIPDVANAGPDSIQIPGTSILLQANEPANGMGVWTIVSGAGGILANSSVPNTLFSGQTGENYTLVWTISNACGSTSDTAIIGFAMTHPDCGIITDSRDGKTYATVVIGTQCWMKENLNVGIRLDSTVNAINNSIPEKHCYQDLETNCDTYGGLYSWNELTNYLGYYGFQGLCPQGWHLPTLAEWNTLIAAVNQDGNTLKAVGQGVAPHGIGTNTSGFSALHAGMRTPANTYIEMGVSGRFYTRSNTSGWPSVFWVLHDNGIIWGGSVHPSHSVPVRCVKDVGQ